MKYIYKVKSRAEFCASVRLYDNKTKCANLHGYTYVVTVVISCKSLSEGVSVDYNFLNFELKNICEKLDYSYLNENDLLKNINPSCENISKLILECLVEKLNLQQGLEVCVELSTKRDVSVSVSCVI